MFVNPIWHPAPSPIKISCRTKTTPYCLSKIFKTKGKLYIINNFPKLRIIGIEEKMKGIPEYKNLRETLEEFEDKNPKGSKKLKEYCNGLYEADVFEREIHSDMKEIPEYKN